MPYLVLENINLFTNGLLHCQPLLEAIPNYSASPSLGLAIVHFG